MVAVTPRTKRPLDAELIRRRATLLRNIFPVKLKFHLLSIPQQKNPTFGTDILQAAVHLLRQFYMTSWLKIEIHVESEQNKIFSELLDLGLKKTGIPLFLGGEWKFEDFSNWCRERMEYEYAMYKDKLLVVKGRNRNEEGTDVVMDWEKFTERTVGGTNTNEAGASFDVSGEMSDDAPSGNDEEERLAKRRMADMLRSRQKRERQRVELQNLKDHSSALIDENERLQAERYRLERLLIEAEECVADLSTDSGDFL